jgi:hypothetical protein
MKKITKEKKNHHENAKEYIAKEFSEWKSTTKAQQYSTNTGNFGPPFGSAPGIFIFLLFTRI